MTCSVCGTVAVPGARFCHHCGAALPGAALPDAASLPAAERRIVTVLFGDLSDFTSWSEDLDPERVGAVTDRVLAALAGAVKTFGGHVDKLTGDGIMAVFGAPVAHEDDAERAVRAALSMQRAVRRVLDDERGGGAPLGLRVGLNTGEVVAGMQAGIEYTVIGDTVNTAARLADAAAVGAVYAGERTSAGTRHVASWRQLRPLRLKGKREPVPTYELLGLHDAPGTRSGLGDEAPFVGREAELGRVSGRLAEAIDSGTPRIMVMTAEAGIGKSRFAGEVKRLAAGYEVGSGAYAGHGARVLRVRCRAFGERRRFAPLADLVRKAAGLPKDVTATVGRTVVEERLRKLANRLGAQLDTDRLLVLLGYGEAPANPGGPTAPADWPPSAKRVDAEAISVAVGDLLNALAAEEPLVVIIDDLHDATATTIDAIGGTLSQLEGPVVVLLLGRPELVRTAGVMTRLADAEVHTLPPLRGADASRLLTSYLGGGKLPQADSDRLLATAQGNPFYLAEMVTLLMEKGALTAAVGANAAGRWQLAAGSLDSQLLSRDLAAVLAARIDALAVEPRAVLRDASVAGTRVPIGVLEALQERRAAESRPGAVSSVELERTIDELLQRRMLHRSRGGYQFTTPLMREAAYAGIGKADLAERHAYLATWAAPETVRRSGHDGAVRLNLTDNERDAFIATHAECAVELADQVRLRPDATAREVAPLGVAALGRMARRALANIEPAAAIEYAERAAALTPDGRLPLADQLVHARALLRLGRVDEALAAGEKITEEAAEEPLCRAEGLILLGRAHEALGDTGRAVVAWQEALEVATEAQLLPERANAMRRLGMADFLAGKLSQASSRFAAAYQVTLAAGDRHGQAWALQNLAWVTTTRGDFAGTDAVLGRAARLFAELGDPVGRSWLRGTTAFARLLAGRLREARRLARIFLPFGDRVGEGWAVGTLRVVEAYAAAELGDLGAADGQARRAYREFNEVSDDWGRGLAMVVRGAIARGLGELEHASDLLGDALAYADRTGHPLLLGMAGTLHGFVALQRGDLATAEADAQRVMVSVEPHNPLAPAQVGPRVLLAEARTRAGDARTAIGLLAPIASDTSTPSLLFSRRHALAAYASALLAEGRVESALTWIERAREVPAEDIRSGVLAAMVRARVLAAGERFDEARASADEAVRLAYSTEQVSERAGAEELRDTLALAGMEPETVAYASDVPG